MILVVKSTVTRFGWPDEFIPHGSSVSQLRKKFKLDESSLYSAMYKKLQSLLKKQELIGLIIIQIFPYLLGVVVNIV